jgi:hypothetical protein
MFSAGLDIRDLLGVLWALTWSFRYLFVARGAISPSTLGIASESQPAIQSVIW